MIVYLVAGKSGIDKAAQDASRELGWTRIGYNRLATPDKDDIRVIVHFSDMIPIPGGTSIAKSKDFDENPDAKLFSLEVSEGRAHFYDKMGAE